MAVDPTYFTCTLGQASTLGLQQRHKTINAFLDAKATEEPNRAVVGFSIPSKSQDWSYQVLTFADIVRASCNLAKHIAARYGDALSERSTVALLCPSTAEFLLTWLALMRIGHAVLLIAPQCPPLAIRSLCEQCDVRLLLYDEVYAEQAKEAVVASESGKQITLAGLPLDDTVSIENLTTSPIEPSSVASFAVTETDVAYLHHTSGTSSGIPKPIPQTHSGAVGVLPCFADGSGIATFTTTPLYHGGIADLFRAWTSSALIWLFPSKALPITASNITQSLDCAARAAGKDGVAKVKYFSSVPYVLQLLESDEKGLQHLQAMEMVGVGGAALPVEIGDRLVSKGVNLLSRFGSAECGFLLSSHRDFAVDKEWQYLRPAADEKFLRFEAQQDGLSELVVSSGWPHMAKRNREDGSYATADLFQAHECIPRAWKYHSRADAQLTLVTGKKFDPAPLESAIATSELLDDALVFGNGKPYPGVLLFRSRKAEEVKDEELSTLIWSAVEQLNRDSQDHAKISMSMLIPMALLERPLEKSSKGTILRNSAEDRFREQIEGAYMGIASGDDGEVADGDLTKTITKIVMDISHKKAQLEEDSDLFSSGIDSVAAIQIRSRLKRLLPEDDGELPMTVVEDSGSIGGLAQYIRKRRKGEHGEDGHEEGPDETQYMRQLVEEYGQFEDVSQRQFTDGFLDETDVGDTVVLTGATGALGAHILDQYRKADKVKKIYCLVRGSDGHAARERVAKGLEERKLAPLDDKVVVLQAQLGSERLGLDVATYEQVAQQATIIMHVAWSVNFRMRLRSFVKDNIAGVTNLIRLALASPRKKPPMFTFCSSVASVMAYADKAIVPERIVDDPNASTPLGYSKSKWVAEQICARANEATDLRGRIGVFRVGQLAGDSEHGVWNRSEAWPIMLHSGKETGSLPALEGEVVNWLPVDLAASALIQGTESTGGALDQSREEVRVFHVLNDCSTPSWMDLMAWVGRREKIRSVSPAVWMEQVSDLGSKDATHPALRLLSHWRKAYANGGSEGVQAEKGSSMEHGERKGFATDQSKSRVPVLRRVRPVDEAYFWKLWRWIVEEM